jgi:hypothetical protein
LATVNLALRLDFQYGHRTFTAFPELGFENSFALDRPRQVTRIACWLFFSAHQRRRLLPHAIRRRAQARRRAPKPVRLGLAGVQGLRVRVLRAGIQLETRRVQRLALVFRVGLVFAVLREIVFRGLVHVVAD